MKLTKDNLEKSKEAVAKRNAEFNALSSVEKRIQIAKDVLAQLKVGKIRPTSAYYENTDYSLSDQVGCLLQNGEDVNFSDILESTDQGSCKVCGIGSLFVAGAARGIADEAMKIRMNYETEPRYKAGRLFAADKLVQVEVLKEYFSKEQLDLIEMYFEQTSRHTFYAKRSEFNADNPISEHSQPARLEAIMRNIVENNGEFIPSKL